MNLAGIQNAMLGNALFDMWEASIQKGKHAGKPHGDPLVAAAAQAFESYIQTVEVQNNALIAGVATYALTPKGGAQGISQQQMAPFLALNIMA